MMSPIAILSIWAMWKPLYASNVFSPSFSAACFIGVFCACVKDKLIVLTFYFHIDIYICYSHACKVVCIVRANLLLPLINKGYNIVQSLFRLIELLCKHTFCHEFKIIVLQWTFQFRIFITNANHSDSLISSLIRMSASWEFAYRHRPVNTVIIIWRMPYNSGIYQNIIVKKCQYCSETVYNQKSYSRHDFLRSL